MEEQIGSEVCTETKITTTTIGSRSIPTKDVMILIACHAIIYYETGRNVRATSKLRYHDGHGKIRCGTSSIPDTDRRCRFFEFFATPSFRDQTSRRCYENFARETPNGLVLRVFFCGGCCWLLSFRRTTQPDVPSSIQSANERMERKTFVRLRKKRFF